MKRHGGVLNEYYYWQDASLKRLPYIVWFHYMTCNWYGSSSHFFWPREGEFGILCEAQQLCLSVLRHIMKWTSGASFYHGVRAKLWGSVTISGCQELGTGGDGWLGWAQGIFKAMKLFCMITVMVDTHLHHLPKPTECTTQRVTLM